MPGKRYEAIVIGVSSGGMEAMKFLFSALPREFSIPIIVVQHMSPHSDSQWISVVKKNFPLEFKEADEKEKILPGHIYIAPPNYHLLVEADRSFSLSVEPKVNYARPAIDVLFQTASMVYKEKLIGIVLTGSNHDGAEGLKQIKVCGGLCIVQDPATAASSYMPQAALEAAQPQYVLSLKKVIDLLKSIDGLI